MSSAFCENVLMSTDAWRRAEEIVDRFLDEDRVSSPRSLAALRERLETEPEPVRREVESLVAHLLADGGARDAPGESLVDACGDLLRDGLMASAPRLLAELASESPASPLAAHHDPGPGDRLGAWRLVEELGRGGMGVVFRAERADRQFEKQVAIKLLASAALGRETQRRFLRERQILAGLDHPSVARLLDGGVTPDGTPFLVMELVDGEPIDRWCARQGAGLEQRLALFLDVCDAVAAAHERLVVHRDIKPGNILVDAEGRVKLLDFGIAGLVEEAGDAPAATVIHAFTPEYASPEQVRLERAGTASDVYSLGVLLYVLLAGRLPYQTAGLRPADVERVVCVTEPAPPSVAVLGALAHQLAGDEAPGSRGSGRDGAERDHGGAQHGSVDRRTRTRLARRLRGDLDQIVAKALAKETARRYPSAAELASDLRRHIAGLPVEARAATASYRAGRFVARHRVGVAAAAMVALSLVVGLAIAASQAVRAARERDLARDEAAKARTVSEFLTELFDQANPFDGAPPDARTLLARGEEKIATELADLPGARADLLGAIGRAYRGLGDYPAALRLSAEALEVKRALLPAPSPALAGAILDHVSVVASAGDQGRAAELAAEALAIVVAAGDEETEIGVRAHRELGNYEPRVEIAERHMRRAIEQRRSLDPGDSVSLAELLHELAILRERQGHAEEGLELKLRALAMLEPLVESGAPVVHQMQSNLAITLAGLGRHEQAEPLHRAGLAGLEARLGPEHPDLIAALTSFGNFLMSRGRFADAAPVVERAVAIAETTGVERFGAIGARVNLATLRREQGRLEEALALYRDAARRFGKLSVGDGTPAAARVDSHVGQTLVRMGRLEQGLERLERALAVQQTSAGVPEPVVAESRLARGVALCRVEATAEARAAVANACATLAHALGAESWQRATCELEQASCELRMDRLEDAAARLLTVEPVIAGRLPADSFWRRSLAEVRAQLDAAGGASPRGRPER